LTIMGASKECPAAMDGCPVDRVEPGVPATHPRILARRKSIRAAQRDNLLALLDQAIDGLDQLARTARQFSVHADALRGLHCEVAEAPADNQDFARLQDRIEATMAGLKVVLQEWCRLHLPNLSG